MKNWQISNKDFDFARCEWVSTAQDWFCRMMYFGTWVWTVLYCKPNIKPGRPWLCGLGHKNQGKARRLCTFKITVHLHLWLSFTTVYCTFTPLILSILIFLIVSTIPVHSIYKRKTCVHLCRNKMHMNLKCKCTINLHPKITHYEVNVNVLT